MEVLYIHLGTLLGTKASAPGGLVSGLIKLPEETKSDAEPDGMSSPV